jgi:threonine dehydratase
MLKVQVEQLIGTFGEGFEAARAAIRGEVVRTPLLPAQSGGGREVRVKAECLQPYGSFKIRAASNLLAGYSPDELCGGVACPSAGNFGQGLAYAAARRRVPLTVHAPDNSAEVKLQVMRELGATVVVHPFDEWWQIMRTRDTGRDDGLFVHPVCEPRVIVGNGTIGLELAEDWPEFDTVVVPVGGGGLISGIALALRSIGHKARIIACEVETAAPLSAALKAGHPVAVDRQSSFVDGIGSTRLLDEMWPLLRELVDEVIVVSVEEAERGVRLAAQQSHLIVEGAAGVALAAALSPSCPGERVVAILSGGNIDHQMLCRILAGGSLTRTGDA